VQKSKEIQTKHNRRYFETNREVENIDSKSTSISCADSAEHKCYWFGLIFWRPACRTFVLSHVETVPDST